MGKSANLSRASQRRPSAYPSPDMENWLSNSSHELGCVPFTTVASMAALFPIEISPHDAIMRACSLLEIALYASVSLRNGRKDYEKGITYHKEAKTMEKANLLKKSALSDLLKDDGKGGNLPIPFWEALSKIMGRGVKRTQRELRFRRFLPTLFKEGACKNNDEKNIFVNRSILEWKKNGIAAFIVERSMEEYSDWWKKSESERKSRDAKERRAKEKEAFVKKAAAIPLIKKKISSRGK